MSALLRTGCVSDAVDGVVADGGAAKAEEELDEGAASAEAAPAEAVAEVLNGCLAEHTPHAAVAVVVVAVDVRAMLPSCKFWIMLLLMPRCLLERRSAWRAAAVMAWLPVLLLAAVI